MAFSENLNFKKFVFFFNWEKLEENKIRCLVVFLCAYPIKVPLAGPMGGTALLLLDNFHSIVKWAKQALHLIGTKWRPHQLEFSTK